MSLLKKPNDNLNDNQKQEPQESPKLNTERIHESILNDIRQNSGVDSGDTTEDERINCMTKDGLFDRWCTWNGLIGWGGKIRWAIQEIYGMEFSR